MHKLFFPCLWAGVKTADPGDSLPTRSESAPTFSQATAEKRNYRPTPNNNNNNNTEINRSKQETMSSIKVKLDKSSGIDEQLQEECRQVWDIVTIPCEAFWH